MKKEIIKALINALNDAFEEVRELKDVDLMIQYLDSVYLDAGVCFWLLKNGHIESLNRPPEWVSKYQCSTRDGAICEKGGGDYWCKIPSECKSGDEILNVISRRLAILSTELHIETVGELN